MPHSVAVSEDSLRKQSADQDVSAILLSIAAPPRSDSPTSVADVPDQAVLEPENRNVFPPEKEESLSSLSRKRKRICIDKCAKIISVHTAVDKVTSVSLLLRAIQDNATVAFDQKWAGLLKQCLSFPVSELGSQQQSLDLGGDRMRIP